MARLVEHGSLVVDEISDVNVDVIILGHSLELLKHVGWGIEEGVCRLDNRPNYANISIEFAQFELQVLGVELPRGRANGVNLNHVFGILEALGAVGAILHEGVGLVL